MNRHCVRNYIDGKEIFSMSNYLSKEVIVVCSNKFIWSSIYEYLIYITQVEFFWYLKSFRRYKEKQHLLPLFKFQKSISKSWTCICYFFSCRCTRAFNFVPNVILDPAGGLFYVSFWCIVYLLLDIKARTNAITERITKNWKLEIVVCIWLELF